MYLLYLQKNKGDVTSFKIEQVLQAFWRTRNCRNIIVSPGHLGYSYAKLLDFYDNLFDANDFSFGMLSGYIWKRSVTSYPYHTSPPNLLIANEMAAYSSLTAKGAMLDIQKFNLDNSNQDHRKMIFLCENSFDTAGHFVVNRGNYRNFVNLISVKGVLIGSSNFSYATYYDSPAPKGEADVFMFYDEEFKDYVVEEYREELEEGSMVLSQSINHVHRNFLENILLETLDSHLV